MVRIPELKYLLKQCSIVYPNDPIIPNPVTRTTVISIVFAKLKPPLE